MNQILCVAKKELRAYFLSPVALIFLGLFLVLAFGATFWVDTFFRRNIADVRPLFHYLPLVLTLLVAALTMRLWSEEQRSGTLEILLTLPIPTHRLVLGKFLAGVALLAVALALTFGFPLTVSTLGDLDWGPVFGGYIGLVLLASAYLSIGLCISAATNNQIVAFLVTWIVCLALYAAGSDVVAGFGGNRVAEVLRMVGAGSRFESIERGVIDLRDLVYYGSICGGFLFLNTVILEAKKWSRGESTRPRRSSLKLSVALVLTNLLVLNVGLASVRTARIDLTERGEYSISPVTKKLLRRLDAPLLLRGYFSAKTHPLLAPLVPRIRDLLDEYEAVGGSKVIAEFIDPQENPAAEKEANEDYSIKSVPFQFADRHQAAVVNSYFHILVKYGDKHETLAFGDLIEVNVSGMQQVEVKLRNLEYDLTRAIKKVVYGFEPLESLFARVPDKITLSAYVTPKTLPQNLEEVPGKITKVAEELQKRSAGKLEYKQIDPSGPENDALRRTLFEKHRIKPFAVSLFGGDTFYLHLLLTSGDKVERVFPAPEASDTELKNEITAALKRMTPGFLKTVALTLPEPKTPPPNPMMGRRPPPPQARGFKCCSGSWARTTASRRLT
jgi:ABC-2 type transport system permease protein